MATLDLFIVNASLPTIQGEIGASGSEGTWIATAYLVAEIVMIPLAGWFERIFGLRNFLLIIAVLFTGFSMMCGVSDALVPMIIARVGQGFTGGAMIPMALSIVATRLPPRQQPLGIALFGMTAVLGPILGPIIGGSLTEHLNWHYAFFINLPIGMGLVALLMFIPTRKARLEMFAQADWLGILGLVLGLGCLTVVLEEGQREHWFESAEIVSLTAASLLGFGLLLAGQRLSRSPVIQLKILLQRSFASVFVMSLAAGGLVYGILYIIPQFLSSIAGYNAEQSGDVTTISGVPIIMMLPFFPILVRVLDIRIAIAGGLLLFGVSCFMDVGITTSTGAAQLFLPQVLRGLGQFFALMFLNQAAASTVAREFAEDASGLFNVARNLGGSFGLAGIASVQDQRMRFHVARLSESLGGGTYEAQHAAQTMGLDWVNYQIHRQAAVMAFADLYALLGVAILAIIPLVLFLKPLPKDG
jgi:MFS transporter, DHA2 family, multidrug resistance protein